MRFGWLLVIGSALQCVRMANASGLVPVEVAENPSYAHKPNHRILPEDRALFSGSASRINEFLRAPAASDVTQVLESLADVEELSHDLDFGIQICEEELYTNLLKIAGVLPEFEVHDLSDEQLVELQDHSLRVVASSLRNNPIARQNAFKTVPGTVVDKLTKLLHTTKSQLVLKRVLGVLLAIIDDSDFLKIVQRHDTEIDILISFPKLSRDSQMRALKLIDDLNLNKFLVKDEDGHELHLTPEELDLKYYEIMKLKLDSLKNHPGFTSVFKSFVEYMETRPVKFDPDFINWLLDEIERRSKDVQLLKRDNPDPTSEKFHQYMLRMRHQVFGNPKALRKTFRDEL